MGIPEFAYTFGALFVGVLTTAAYTLMGLTPPHSRVARILFVMAALIAIGMTIVWDITTPVESRIARFLAVAVVAGSVCGALAETWRWIATREKSQSADTRTKAGAPPVQTNANIDVKDVSDFRASNNITLGPGKLVKAEGGKNIVIEGNFIDMANRQSESLEDFRDADLKGITNTQLRSTMIEFAKSVRGFGENYKNERNSNLSFGSPQTETPEQRHKEWEKSIKRSEEASNMLQRRFNDLFRGQMLALLSEAAHRANLSNDIRDYGRLIAFRSFAGVDAIGEAADQVEKAARKLPSD